MLKKKSVLFTWCLSYGLLLLMMVVMCVMLGGNARQQLILEYKSITQTLQAQTNTAINSYFSELERCAYEIGNDYIVNDFLMAANPNGSKYYVLTPIQQLLSVHALQTGAEVERYLYMNNIDSALSSETIYRKEELYNALGLERALTEAAFEALLTEPHYNELRVLDVGDASEVLMLTSVPVMGRSPKGLLIQRMAPDTLEWMMRSNEAVEGSTTVLLDANGLLVCQTGEADAAQLLQNANLSQIKESEIVLGGQSYWIQQELLNKTGWHLLTVVPMKSIQEKSDWIIWRALPVMLAMVAGTAALCMCFLYINYKPLSKLRHRVAGAQKQAEGNEYDQLISAFSGMENSLSQMQMLQEKQAEQLRLEFLSSCLEYDVDFSEEHLQLMMSRLGVHFAGEWFSIVLLEAHGEEDCGSEDSAICSVQQMLQTAVAQEQNLCSVEMLPRGMRLVALLNYAQESTAHQMQAKISEQLQAVAAQNEELGLLFACGRTFRGLGKIHLAYLNACELLWYHQEKTTQGEMKAMAAQSAHNVLRFSSEQEDLLLRYILAGNAAEAQDVLEIVIRHNLCDAGLSLAMSRCLAFDIIASVLKNLAVPDAVWEQQKQLIENDFYQLRHAHTQQEISAVLRETVARIAGACAESNSKNTALRSQPIDRTIRCVEEHFREGDFNVSKAADYLGMNVTYLSRLFKTHTGIGLLNYINGLRVNYAKECMANEHLTVAQAAREAGFENANTFIRIFRKYEGVTPGSYLSGQ